jgi:hypothetical protein
MDLTLLQALGLANIQTLVLAQRDPETYTSVGTRRLPQALDMTLLQALGPANIQALVLANIHAPGLTQRDAETDTSVGTIGVVLRHWT